MEKYNKRCQIIEKLIISQFPDLKFKLVFNNDTKYYEIFLIEQKAQISILENTEWKALKRGIELKIKQEYNTLCSICYENINKNVSCSKCYNNWCGECYISLFISGEGIIKCPFCRYSFGIKTPKNMINICVQEIRDKLNGIWNIRTYSNLKID